MRIGDIIMLDATHLGMLVDIKDDVCTYQSATAATGTCSAKFAEEHIFIDAVDITKVFYGKLVALVNPEDVQ